MATKTKTTIDTFSVGDIELSITKIPGEFVPESHPFVENRQMLETISFGIKENLPVLLIGETGVGKTSAIRWLAHNTNNNFRRLNLNGQTTVDEFVGKNLINKEGTYWIDGILTDAMRKGHWLLLDEINAALPEVLFVLQSLLDDDRYIVLSDKPEVRDEFGNVVSSANEVVRPHPDFRLFASMNPSDGYVGTKELNKALMSRFPIVLEIDYPDETRELEIVDKRFPGFDEYEAKRLIEFGNELRSTYKAHELDFVFDTRTLLNWIKVNGYFKDWIKSAEVTFLAKCNQEDRESVRSLMKVHFASESFKATELQSGDELVLFADVAVHNKSEMISKKSTLRVADKATSKGKDMIVLEVLSIPKEAHNSAKYVQKAERWAVMAAELDGKFQLRKKRKASEDTF